jgi:hypothetical protein
VVELGDVSLLQNVQTGSGSYSDSCSMHTRVLPPEESGKGVKVTTHLNLVSKLRMSGAITLFSSIPSWCEQGQLHTFAWYIFFYSFKFFSDLIFIYVSSMITLLQSTIQHMSHFVGTLFKRCQILSKTITIKW